MKRSFKQVDVFARPQQFDPIVALFGEEEDGPADLGGEFAALLGGRAGERESP